MLLDVNAYEVDVMVFNANILYCYIFFYGIVLISRFAEAHPLVGYENKWLGNFGSVVLNVFVCVGQK